MDKSIVYIMSSYSGIITRKAPVTGTCPICKNIEDDYVKTAKIDRVQYSIFENYMCYSCFLKEALRKAGIHYVK